MKKFTQKNATGVFTDIVAAALFLKAENVKSIATLPLNGGLKKQERTTRKSTCEKNIKEKWTQSLCLNPLDTQSLHRKVYKMTNIVQMSDYRPSDSKLKALTLGFDGINQIILANQYFADVCPFSAEIIMESLVKINFELQRLEKL